jgi:uncharacterized membrane protein YeaQ/YmgE (transglycosylase-associated protein family)
MVVGAVSGGTVLLVILSGFVTGGLARLAVPGPDPMPAWLTIAIGLVGSAAGGGIAYAAGARNPFAINTASFIAAVLLVIGYRRFVQKRPVLGPEALRFPKRGVGIQGYRERLRRVGVDPDQAPFAPVATAPAPSQAKPADEEYSTEGVEQLQKLADLHDAGVLTDEEFDAKRRLVIEWIRSPEGKEAP